MPRPSTDTRERLLAAAVDYAAEHGLADLSLRTLAAGLGTSHRMLIFHFGSKEGLLVEVVRAVEAQQRALLEQLRADPRLDPLDQMRAFWQHLASPALWPYERLFFEVYAQGLQGKWPAKRLLEDVIDAWLPPIADLLAFRGAAGRGARRGAPRDRRDARPGARPAGDRGHRRRRSGDGPRHRAVPARPTRVHRAQAWAKARVISATTSDCEEVDSACGTTRTEGDPDRGYEAGGSRAAAGVRGHSVPRRYSQPFP
jgi:AcrR family transcriptional regulator